MHWNVYIYNHFREGWVIQHKKVWATSKDRAYEYARIIFGRRKALFVRPMAC